MNEFYRLSDIYKNLKDTKISLKSPFVKAFNSEKPNRGFQKMTDKYIL